MHSGTRIRPYEIASSIGAGGMGEVFRARDTRLHHDVAVKVLPKDFVAETDRLRRFEQEAKTLAALNHPNVLTVFAPNPTIARWRYAEAGVTNTWPLRLHEVFGTIFLTPAFSSDDRSLAFAAEAFGGFGEAYPSGQIEFNI